jgi:hypothetical protein
MLSAAAFAADWCRPLTSALLGLTVLILIATFANKLPLLHLLPLVGAPRVIATFEQLPRPSGAPHEILLRIGLYVPTRLEDAVLNFLFPDDIPDCFNADWDGQPSGKGRLMLPTNELLTPGIELSKYWAHNVDLRHGAGLIGFVLIVGRPRQFNVRLRVGSEKLYKGGFDADFEVVVA